jgi:glycosyltransferase involved in cell wall biosynthesis/ubiquinone/menaquinone biosynthesis C-methylase UbiE
LVVYALGDSAAVLRPSVVGDSVLEFTGERLVPGAANCEPTFGSKMYHEHAARYLFAAQLVEGARVLDVGCGVGYGSALLADRGAVEVVAFDVSEEAIRHAERNFARPQISYHVGSADSFDFGRFDVVTCFELVEHLHDQDGLVARLARSLARDGTALISTPRRREGPPRSAFHVNELSFEEFNSLLGNHFSSVDFWYEGNQFGSRIDAHVGSSPTATTFLKPEQFEPEQADYFVAVARHSPLAGERLGSVSVLDDDAYVRTLEHDVDVLREIELLLTERTRELEREVRRAEVLRSRAEGHLVAVTQTISWRLTYPLRRMRAAVARWAEFVRRLRAARARSGLLGLIRGAAMRVATVFGVASVSPSRLWTEVALDDSDTLADLESGLVDVVFLVGCWDGQSKRYRVSNIATGLRELGISVVTLDASDIGLLLEYGIRPRRLVVFRAPLAQNASEQREVFRHVRRHGGLVVADFDDLVFEPSILHAIDGFRELSRAEREEYVEGVFGYRRMVEEVDIVTCSTPSLAEHVQSLGLRSGVVRNSLDRAQLDLASELVADRRSSGAVKIVYLSGSSTHQADFTEVAEALERILEERTDVTFTVIGYLRVPESWARFGSRVRHMPFLPYLDLLRATRSFDVNIAPLVVGNAFCEAKSELKVFEAGLVGVPTVASPTRAYAAAISDGIDGLLAASPEEWYQKITALIESRDLRESMGRAARVRAIECFCYQTATRDFVAAVEFPMPTDTARALNSGSSDGSQGRTRVGWIVPGLIIGGGGHRNILRAAYQLEARGYDVDLYFTEWTESKEELNRQIKAHFYDLAAEAEPYAGTVRHCDALLATHWSTVSVALENKHLARELMYFVQDFEPLFYPMGTEYLLAENTYRQRLYHITSGPWCARILRERYGAEADYFQFPVDTTVYYRRGRTDDRKRLLFFAKPEMPRRCYELGVQAISAFHRLRPDVEIVFFGSAVDPKTLDFPVVVRGVLGLDELAELYSNSDFGMVFSPTNPSLVPYEMMACGLTVVDLQTEYGTLNYGGRDDIAVLVEPDPAAIAAKLADLLAEPFALQECGRRGSEFAATFPTEDEMGERVRELIDRRLNGIRTASKEAI